MYNITRSDEGIATHRAAGLCESSKVACTEVRYCGVGCAPDRLAVSKAHDSACTALYRPIAAPQMGVRAYAAVHAALCERIVATGVVRLAATAVRRHHVAKVAPTCTSPPLLVIDLPDYRMQLKASEQRVRGISWSVEGN